MEESHVSVVPIERNRSAFENRPTLFDCPDIGVRTKADSVNRPEPGLQLLKLQRVQVLHVFLVARVG